MHGQAFLVPIGVAFHFDLLEFSWCVAACVVVLFKFLFLVGQHSCTKHVVINVRRWAAAGTTPSTSSLVRFTGASALRRPSTCTLDAVVFACATSSALLQESPVLCVGAAWPRSVCCAVLSISYAISERLAAP